MALEYSSNIKEKPDEATLTKDKRLYFMSHNKKHQVKYKVSLMKITLESKCVRNN